MRRDYVFSLERCASYRVLSGITKDTENVQILSGELEGGKTLAEEDLTAMVKKLKRLLDESETARRDDAKESMDYYTTWVHQIKTPISTMKMMLEGEDSEESRSLLSELFRIEQYA